MPSKSPKPKEAELLDAARSAAMEELRRKLDAGEPLSAAQLDRLEKWTRRLGKKPGADLVATKGALADAIPCSHVTLNKYWNTPGHPKRPQGETRHSVAACRQFIATVSELDLGGAGIVPTSGQSENGSVDTAEDRSLKRRKLLADAERAEVERDQAKHDLEVSRETWIKKETAGNDVRRCNEAVKQELMRRFKQTAPAEYEAVGGDIEECRKINEAHLLAAFEFMHSGNW